MANETQTYEPINPEDFQQALHAGAFRALARRGFPGQLELAEDGMPANLDLMEALIRFKHDPRLAGKLIAFRGALDSGNTREARIAGENYAEGVVALYAPEPQWLIDARKQYIEAYRAEREARD